MWCLEYMQFWNLIINREAGTMSNIAIAEILDPNSMSYTGILELSSRKELILLHEL